MAAYLLHASLCFRAALSQRAAAVAGIVTQLAFAELRVQVLSACYALGVAAPGMPLAAALDYIWLGQAFLRLIPMRPDEDLTDAMRSGTLANDLCRPVDAYWWWWSRAIGRCAAPTLLRCVPLILFSLAMGVLRPPHSLGCGLACLDMLVLALLVSSAIRLLLALLGDWSGGANSVAILGMPVIWVLAGIVVPLPLFPPALQGLISILPFRALLDSPLRAWSGDLHGPALGWAMLHQVVWLAVLVGLGRLLTRRGLRRLIIQGG